MPRMVAISWLVQPRLVSRTIWRCRGLSEATRAFMGSGIKAPRTDGADINHEFRRERVYYVASILEIPGAARAKRQDVAPCAAAAAAAAAACSITVCEVWPRTETRDVGAPTP